MLSNRIETDEHVAAALVALCAADPDLARIRAAVRTVPLRRRPPGFDGLLRVVVGQQLSTRAAGAIWTRLEVGIGALSAQTVLAAAEKELRAAGLSQQKIRTFRGIAEHVAGGFDLDRVADGSAAEALAALQSLPGVGRWTANVYLLFCVGHPDVFPAGDLALQRAAAAALALDPKPTPDQLDEIALRWSPHRSTAARLLWAYYAALRDEARAGRPESAARPRKRRAAMDRDAPAVAASVASGIKSPERGGEPPEPDDALPI